MGLLEWAAQRVSGNVLRHEHLLLLNQASGMLYVDTVRQRCFLLSSLPDTASRFIQAWCLAHLSSPQALFALSGQSILGINTVKCK